MFRRSDPGPILVADAAGARIEQGPLAISADRKQLEVVRRPLPPGEYAVAWVVVSVDTHRTESNFRFIVLG